MARAYAVASPGQRVLLVPGEYSAQSLEDARPRAGEPVTFAPAGEKVTIRSLTVHGASRFVIRRIGVSEQILIENQHPERDGSSDVTLADVTAKTLRLVGRISNISVRGGSYGSAVNAQPQIKKYNPTDPDVAAPSNILIDGASFHDFRRSDRSVHTECLQILSGNGIVLRNSRFWNCDGTGAIGITPASVIVGLTIENNFISGGGDTGFAVQIGMLQRDFTFRYNSSTQPVFFSDSNPGGPYMFVGNYMPHSRSLCRAAATYRNNVLAGGTCGPSDVRVSSLVFVDAGNHDLHLTRGSPASGRGAVDAAPAADIDGDRRPTRLAPDAGADQRETALLRFDRSVGEVALGASERTITDFYGPGGRSRAELGGRPLTRIAYRLHQGRLRVYVDRGAVVGVDTTSRFYETPSGAGAGSQVSRTALPGFSWDECHRAYQRSFRGSTARATTANGRRGGVVRRLLVVRRGYGACLRRPR